MLNCTDRFLLFLEVAIVFPHWRVMKLFSGEVHIFKQSFKVMTSSFPSNLLPQWLYTLLRNWKLIRAYSWSTEAAEYRTHNWWKAKMFIRVCRTQWTVYKVGTLKNLSCHRGNCLIQSCNTRQHLSFKQLQTSTTSCWDMAHLLGHTNLLHSSHWVSSTNNGCHPFATQFCQLLGNCLQHPTCLLENHRVHNGSLGHQEKGFDKLLAP